MKSIFFLWKCNCTQTEMTSLLFESLKIIVPVVAAIIVLAVQLQYNRQTLAEGTFFNLLNSIRSMVSNTIGNVVSKDATTQYHGVDYFNKASKELINRQHEALGSAILEGVINIKEKDEATVAALHKRAIDTYDAFFEKHVPELSHYFRFTYNVIKFVDKHKYITEDKKKEYIKFIQAQMTDGELQLIYFNGVGRHGANYYDMIEKYNFLQNMDTSKSKGIVESLYRFYPKSDFR
jgi:hypothetical protein